MADTEKVVQFSNSKLDVIANRIRSLGKQSVANVIEIGKLLVEAKDDIKKREGHGKWLPWLQREFDWGIAQAARFMQVHAVASKFINLINLDLDVSALYLLAAPAIDNVRDKVIDDVVRETKKTSKRATHQIVKQTIQKYKPSKPRRSKARKNAAEAERLAASLVLDEGMSYEQAAAQAGIDGSVQVMKTAVAREEGRREPVVDREDLSLTAQQKFDVAIKRERIRMKEEIRKQVHTENLSWWKTLLDQQNKNAEHYKIVLAARKGIMSRNDYRLIRACLHPDRVMDVGEKRKYQHCFTLFEKLEKILLDEKQSPTPPSGLPKTVEELLKRKAEFKAQQAANRAAKRKNAPTKR